MAAEGSRPGLTEHLCGGTEGNKKLETYFILKLPTPCNLATKCTQYVKYIYLSPGTSYMFQCLSHHLQRPLL
jgi:hypothetical protein